MHSRFGDSKNIKIKNVVKCSGRSRQLKIRSFHVVGRTKTNAKCTIKVPLSLLVDIGSLLYALVNVFHPNWLIRSNFRLRRSENLHKDSHQNSWTHVQSVQNCWFSLLNMQICDVLVVTTVSICQAPYYNDRNGHEHTSLQTQVCTICNMKKNCFKLLFPDMSGEYISRESSNIVP